MLLKAFLQQCALRPDAIAMIEQDRQLSYSECLNRAQSIAHALQVRGITGQVAIHLERGIDAAVAIFGVLLAGACYVPLDLKNPPARLIFTVDDAQVGAVLGLGSAPHWLNKALWLDIGSCSDALPSSVAITAESLAAILYTSGSTGQPRGVALSHGAIMAFAHWATDLLALNPNDRIASSTPFFFDLSTFDLYAVLGAGASLYFMPPMLTMSPARLSTWLNEHLITGWYTVPSLLAFLAYKGNLSQTPLSNLRFLLFAGEVFPTPALITLADYLPQVALYNFFGPTETNVCCFWRVQREKLSVDESIPIGVAAADCALHIDDENGELWVRGSTLASGYWCKGRLQAFLNSQGWYATGDKVSLLQGEYHFHGRLGRLLKCSGFRVEPAEIEAVVNAIKGVTACAVVGVTDATAGQRPALAVVLGDKLTIADIRKVLNQQLPTYMQPSRYQILDALPRLANGKLDYQTLQKFFES